MNIIQIFSGNVPKINLFQHFTDQNIQSLLTYDHYSIY